MEPDGVGPAIGIDLGTTYSCVAIYHHGRVDVVVNRQGNRTTPSYVAFTADDLLVGEAAKNQAARNPTNTIYDAKRLIGRRFADAQVQSDLKLWPFKVTGDGADGGPMLQVEHKGARRQLAPQEISAILLRELRGMAEAYLGSAVRDAVVTVPAHFSHSQRRATKEAGEAAGLRVMRVLSEPTAAAVAYGLDGNRSGGAAGRTVLIFDLGGGTFDVSLLSVCRGEVHVRAASGDGHLGGVDFDGRLVDHCVRQFERTHGVDGLGGSPRALARLRAACEEAKKNLSFLVEVDIEVECLHEGLDLRTTVSRARFEELTADLLERCMGCVRGCLRDAEVEPNSVDEVVLVGGSTRIPRVQELVTEMFGAGRLCRSINPDEAVAHGAAIRAAALGGSSVQKLRGDRDLALRDVTPLSLGLRTLGGVMNVLIPRNTPIPAAMEKDFTTTKDGQTALTFVVYEGERSLVENNNLLGRFTLSGIPGAGRSGPRVRVVFSVDEDGILTVTARDKASGRTAEERIVVDGKLRLRAADVQRRVEGAASNRKTDAEARRKVEARIRLAEVAEELREGGSKDAAAEVLSWLESNYEKVGAEEIDRKRMTLEFRRGGGSPATPVNESKLHRRKWFVFWK